MWFHPRRESEGVQLPVLQQPDDELDKARMAQQDTHRRFLEAVEEGQEIRQVSSTMRTLRIRNGYEDKIEDALARRPERYV